MVNCEYITVLTDIVHSCRQPVDTITFQVECLLQIPYNLVHFIVNDKLFCAMAWNSLCIPRVITSGLFQYTTESQYIIESLFICSYSFIIFNLSVWLWDMAGNLAAVLPKCLRYLKVAVKFKTQSSTSKVWWDFMLTLLIGKWNRPQAVLCGYLADYWWVIICNFSEMANGGGQIPHLIGRCQSMG